MYVGIKIQAEAVNLDEECRLLQEKTPNCGALVTFTGYVRRDSEEGKALDSLTLEHYPGMAEQQIGKWIAEAARRWSLQGVQVLHRVGKLRPGELIVWVAVASTHRADAFSACEFLMDHLKSAVPFWKKEALSPEEGRWLESREADRQRLARWHPDS